MSVVIRTVLGNHERASSQALFPSLLPAVAALTLTIAGCFAYTIAAAKPSWREVGIGLLPG